MLEYHITATRVDAHGSVARCKNAEIALDTDETDRRLELLHDNVKKFGTVFNTVAPGTALSGVMRRKDT